MNRGDRSDGAWIFMIILYCGAVNGAGPLFILTLWSLFFFFINAMLLKGNGLEKSLKKLKFKNNCFYQASH